MQYASIDMLLALSTRQKKITNTADWNERLLRYLPFFSRFANYFYPMLNFSHFKYGRINSGYLDTNELTLKKPKMRITESLNSTDPDEVAHHEPPHLDLHCLPSSL